VRGSVTLLAGGENTWGLMDGNMLGKVRPWSVDLIPLFHCHQLVS
jgi:hypothetical protein